MLFVCLAVNAFIFFVLCKLILYHLEDQNFLPFAKHTDHFKVGLSRSKKFCVICLIESPLKMMKNAFYFI